MPHKISRTNSLLRVLYVTIAALVLVIVVTTVWAFSKGIVPNAQNDVRPMDELPLQSDNGDNLHRLATFSGLGKFRVPLDKGTLVLSIVFPYDSSDLGFTEELVGKIGLLRQTTNDLLKNLKADDSLLADETSLKEKLIVTYNGLLRLGRIDTLYFPDFILIE
jgi:flagellar basal body-associated protein FliL